MTTLLGEFSLDDNYILPSEIWNIIINMLTRAPRSMMAASKVCKQWRHLVTRICQKYCAHHLEQRLLMELCEAVNTQKCCWIKENDRGSVTGEEWIEIFWLYYETFLDTRSFEQRDIIYSLESITNITSEDPYLLVSTYAKNDDKTTVHAFCSLDFPFCEEYNDEKKTALLLDSLCQSFTFDVEGKVLKICLLTLPTPVLLLITSSDMRAVVLPNAEERGEAQECQIMFTDPRIIGHPKTRKRWETTTNQNMDVAHNLLDTFVQPHSVPAPSDRWSNIGEIAEGNHFVTQDPKNGDFLLLYKASFLASRPVKALKLTLKCRFKTEASSYSWILSRGLVKTMETSGHIRTYRIKYLETQIQRESYSDSSEDENEEGESLTQTEENAELCAESELKKDLRYPNPTLFTKDFLFSSTLVSRDLLGYWHMDRDRDYWLIGDTSPKISTTGVHFISPPANIQLHQVTLGQEIREVVTAVHFQRGILFCGTKEGHLLGYKLQNNFNDADKSCFDDLRGLPWFIVSGVASQSIFRLGSLFTPFGLLVAVGEENGRCSLLHIPLENPLR